MTKNKKEELIYLDDIKKTENLTCVARHIFNPEGRIKDRTFVKKLIHLYNTKLSSPTAPHHRISMFPYMKCMEESR